MRLKPFFSYLGERQVRGGKDVWGSDEIETTLPTTVAHVCGDGGLSGARKLSI
jgi:hypothetical protein